MATPKTANISVTIGSIDIIVHHSNFSSLTIKRSASDTCDSFKLNVLDDAAFDIEYELLKGNNDITISYIDDDNGIYKTLNGEIIKMSSAFIDNRNMLTLDGYVSIKIEDKYEPVSMSWNVVPLFKWEDVFTDPKEYTSITMDVEEGSASLWKKFWQEAIVRDGVTYTIETLQNTVGRLFGARKTQDALESLKNKFTNNQIRMDDDGNYYILSDVKKDINGNPAYVKATGSITIPMKPGAVIKSMVTGGKYGELIAKDTNVYTNAGSSFSKKTNLLDMAFVAGWFEKMDNVQGGVKGIGNLKVSKWDDTDYVEDELVQTRTSRLSYIYNDLLNKCVYTDENGATLSNYYLGINDNEVKFQRVDASRAATEEPVAQYTYYGKFNPSEKNKGVMTSFNATLNVLTSMITNGTNTSEDADISSLNLVTGETTSASLVSKNDEIVEQLYKPSWGDLTYTLANSTGNDSTTSIASVFDKAKNMCYKANATISGFNKLSPLDFIEIIVVPTTRSDGSQLYHHTSGKYYIMSVEDVIENGTFTTTLDLIKNIQSSGLTNIKVNAEIDNEARYVVNSGTVTDSTLVTTYDTKGNVKELSDKDSGYFSNGYQPNNIDGYKLEYATISGEYFYIKNTKLIGSLNLKGKTMSDQHVFVLRKTISRPSGVIGVDFIDTTTSLYVWVGGSESSSGFYVNISLSDETTDFRTAELVEHTCEFKNNGNMTSGVYYTIKK